MSMPEATLGFGVALDPLKPRELITPPGLATVPPTCPVCGTLLHPVDQNPAGDVYFECLNGDVTSAGHYSAVYRVATKAWDQHPAFRRPDWTPPGRVVPPSAATTPVRRMKRRRKKRASRSGGGALPSAISP